jgi:hypothetical protein
MKLIASLAVCAMFAAPAFRPAVIKSQSLKDSVPTAKKLSDSLPMGEGGGTIATASAPKPKVAAYKFTPDQLYWMYEAFDNSIELPLHKKNISADSARRQIEFYRKINAIIGQQLFDWYVDDSLAAKPKAAPQPAQKKKK